MGHGGHLGPARWTMGLIPRLGAPKHASQSDRAPKGVPGSGETRAQPVSTDQQALNSVWASGSQAYESLGVTLVILGLLGGLWGLFLDSGHQNIANQSNRTPKGVFGSSQTRAPPSFYGPTGPEVAL